MKNVETILFGRILLSGRCILHKSSSFSLQNEEKKLNKENLKLTMILLFIVVQNLHDNKYWIKPFAWF